MTAIQIRDVPAEVRDALAERARTRGQSLSSYLREVIIREARFAENVQLLDDIENWPGHASFSVDDVVKAIESDRSGMQR